MTSRSITFVLLAALVVVAGCKKQSADADGSVAPSDAAQPVAETGAGSSPGSAAASKGFDIDSIPMSTATLGDFPYVTLPASYRLRTEKSKDFARFPFWVDGQARWVEGRFHEFNFDKEEGKGFSQFEVAKNIEALVTQMGGVKVSEAQIPDATIESWGEEITVGFIDGIGDVYNNPAATYLVRRGDGNIWIHFVADSAQAWMVVGQEAGFKATASLLPASELKKQIDQDGKVALQVNFATDKTDILAESQPQIDQVVKLLGDDSALQLDVNGHTDNSGDAARNQTLSEGRAQAVVSAIIAKGVAADRLTAHGFGDTQPIADNSSEDGKARNRRVELVKR